LRLFATTSKAIPLEATWLKVTEIELKRVKCRNYSIEQKDEFLADCGQEGQKYVDMANW